MTNNYWLDKYQLQNLRYLIMLIKMFSYIFSLIYSDLPCMHIKLGLTDYLYLMLKNKIFIVSYQ